MQGGAIAIIAAVLGAAVVFSIALKWWTDGALNGTEVFAVTTFYGGLVFGMCVSLGHPVALTITIALLVGSLGWVIYQNQRYGIKRYYRDKIKVYEAAIRADPTNMAARTSMAEAYYSIGDLDRAIGSLEMATEIGTSSIRDSHRLRDWREQRELKQSKTIVCPSCHCKNVWGAVQCRVCNRPVDYAHLSAWDDLADNPMKLRLLAAAGIWIVVGILSLTLIRGVQGWIVLGCVTLTEAGWLLLSSK